MQPDIRRIIAVDAHRRRSGRCPVLVYSLGTGESFEIRPTADGFVTSRGRSVGRRRPIGCRTRETIDIHMNGDDARRLRPSEPESFSGRAGGGASVTLYDAGRVNYFQYAVVAEGDRL